MATIISLALSIAAAGLSMYAYIEGRRRDRRDILLKLQHEMLLSDDGVRGRQVLYDKVTGEAAVEALSDRDYRDAHRAVGMMNTLAYYMMKGYVAESDVLGLWAYALHRACRAARPLLTHREHRTGQHPWIHLDYLARRTENYLARKGAVPDFKVWRRQA